MESLLKDFATQKFSTSRKKKIDIGRLIHIFKNGILDHSIQKNYLSLLDILCIGVAIGDYNLFFSEVQHNFKKVMDTVSKKLAFPMHTKALDGCDSIILGEYVLLILMYNFKITKYFNYNIDIAIRKNVLNNNTNQESARDILGKAIIPLERNDRSSFVVSSYRVEDLTIIAEIKRQNLKMDMTIQDLKIRFFEVGSLFDANEYVSEFPCNIDQLWFDYSGEKLYIPNIENLITYNAETIYPWNYNLKNFPNTRDKLFNLDIRNVLLTKCELFENEKFKENKKPDKKFIFE